MKTTLKHTALALACAWALALPARGQESRRLTLDEVRRVAAANNATVRVADLERRLAHVRYRQSDAALLPHVSVGYQALVTDHPMHAFGFLLQQSGVTAQSFDPAKLNHPDATANYGAALDVQLPLLNLDHLYARKAARLQEEVYADKAQYTRDYIDFEVSKAYAQLQLAHRSRTILMGTLADVRRIHQSVANFETQGLVQRSDVLNAQVQVNTVESALARAESHIANASEALLLLMGEPLEASPRYVPDSLEQLLPRATAALNLAGRGDVQALQKAVEASQLMVKSARLRFAPRVNAFGSFQLNDRKVFGFGNGSYLAGVSLNWSLFSGNADRYKLRAAQVQHAKMQQELAQHLDRSLLEARKTARDLSDLQTDIAKHTASVGQAAEALRILADRHREGLASTTDLLQAQTQHAQQQLLQAQAVMNYNITQYYQDLLLTNP